MVLIADAGDSYSPAIAQVIPSSGGNVMTFFLEYPAGSVTFEHDVKKVCNVFIALATSFDAQ